MSRQRSTGIPWWAKAAIAVGTVVAGAVVVYEIFAGPQAAATAALNSWTKDYMNELTAITKQGNLPTQSQEYVLAQKQKQIDDAYNRLFTVYGVAQNVLIGAVVTGGLVWLASSVAKTYLRSRGSTAKTPDEAIQYVRAAHAIDLYEIGHTTLAIDLQTQTNALFSSLYSPLIQAEIGTLQASTATLIGTQLALTQLLVTNLDVALATEIPTLLQEALSILETLPPPPGV